MKFSGFQESLNKPKFHFRFHLRFRRHRIPNPLKLKANLVGGTLEILLPQRPLRRKLSSDPVDTLCSASNHKVRSPDERSPERLTSAAEEFTSASFETKLRPAGNVETKKLHDVDRNLAVESEWLRVNSSCRAHSQCAGRLSEMKIRSSAELRIFQFA